MQPDTVLRWHREMFRWYWRRKSKGGQKKTKIDAETINLIRQMAKENPLWGGERIQGELLKLGLKIHPSTVKNVLHLKSGKTSYVAIESLVWGLLELSGMD